MFLSCLVQVEDLNSPSLSCTRFVQCNLYLGATNVKKFEPVLILVTSKIRTTYKVTNNIKKICKNEIHNGKISISLHNPSHLVLIKSDFEKLYDFIHSLNKLNSKNSSKYLKNIPIILKVEKPHVKSCTKINSIKSSIKSEENLIICKIVPLSLREKLRAGTKELNLYECNIKKWPIELGQLPLCSINLEKNIIQNHDLLWLEELNIRKSLQSLNLKNNKLTCFPSVLINFHNLSILDLSKNEIKYIPGTIGRLQTLRYLNLSENNISFLPASIIYLRLDTLDLTHNHLTGSKLQLTRDETGSFRNCLRLEDFASVKIDPFLCRYLTTKDCPQRLLEKLRCLSRCICGKVTNPFYPAQFFQTLKGNEHFATTIELYPQKSGEHDSNFIYLQYHFCEFLNRCENQRFLTPSPPFSCYNLKF